MCVVTFCVVATARSPFAQEHVHVPVDDQTIKGWTLTSGANVFVGYDYQHRKFTDFSAWESQNWFMLTAAHPIGAGRLVLLGMASLEPFTLKALGSPQVFQTGETYKNAPLIDYLLEWDWQATPGGAVYGRGEVVDKDILTLGSLHPRGFIHFHQISRVAALTIGYVRDVSSTGWGRVGVGGDATVYRLSDDLLLPYGSPQSFHLFLRWRSGGDGAAPHVH